MEDFRRFFDTCADFDLFADQWLLDDPRTADGKEIDSLEFTEGRPYKGPLPVAMPIAHAGREVAFHLGAFDMPVVSTRVGQLIQRIAPREAELLPVDIPGAKERHAILNAICLVNCLDEFRSEFTRWELKDNRPEMMGQYKMISTIRIDPLRAGGHHIFRIMGWPLALIVSDMLKDILEDIPNLGVRFLPVT
jgi:hypothetical protein